MALILQLETAEALSCSVALSENGILLSFKEISKLNTHESCITNFVLHAMNEANKAFHQLDAIAVSMGPGSYTGLRIGLSTAKGLCYALDKPLIGINTLQSMAAGMNDLSEKTDFLCPMIDAKRMEIYTALYTSQLEEIRPAKALIIDRLSFSDLLTSSSILFFGSGANKSRDVIRNENAKFITDFQQSARHLSSLAFEKYKIGEFENVAHATPFYLKDVAIGPPKK